MQSAVQNYPSPERKNIALITNFTGMEPYKPISTFIRFETVESVTVSNIDRERLLNITNLQRNIEERYYMVNNAVHHNRSRNLRIVSKVRLPKFPEGYSILLPKDDFIAGEKLSIRRREPKRVVKVLSDYIFHV